MLRGNYVLEAFPLRYNNLSKMTKIHKAKNICGLAFQP